MALLNLSDAAREAGTSSSAILRAIQSGRLSANKTADGDYQIDTAGLFCLLGAMYDNGRGVPQDFASASKWYRRAAEEGDAGAQTTLGFMYSSGRGVPRDDVLAHMWFNLAAAQGHDIAREQRDSVGSLMTENQIIDALLMARDWKPTAARRTKAAA